MESHRGGARTAASYSQTITAKLNDVDPRARLADVPACLTDHPRFPLYERLPGTWRFQP